MLFFPVFACTEPRSVHTASPQFRGEPRSAAIQPRRSHLHRNPSRINTCKSVSKQTALAQDYSLDKSYVTWDTFLMESNPQFFFGLAAASVLRMSFLMLASNFRVGTCFNSFLRPASNGDLP